MTTESTRPEGGRPGRTLPSLAVVARVALDTGTGLVVGPERTSRGRLPGRRPGLLLGLPGPVVGPGTSVGPRPTADEDPGGRACRTPTGLCVIVVRLTTSILLTRSVLSKEVLKIQDLGSLPPIYSEVGGLSVRSK